MGCARALALSLGLIASLAPAEAQEIRLEVSSSSEGLHYSDPRHPDPPQVRAFVVTCVAENCNCTLGDAPVASSLVRELLAEAVAEPRSALDLGALGITPEWLRSEATAETKRIESDVSLAHYTPKTKRDAFFTAMLDMPLITEIITSRYRSERTDDYPYVSARVTLPDGKTITMSSTAQHPFMIPWHISRKDGAVITFNPRIGSLLASLSPASFLNRSRLSGESLRPWLVHEVWDRVHRECNATAARAGP